MTDVIGSKTEDGVWMCADSAIGNITLDGSKLVMDNGVLAGFAGNRDTINFLITGERRKLLFSPCIEDEFTGQKIMEAFRIACKNSSVGITGIVDVLISAGSKLILLAISPGFFYTNIKEDYYAIGSGSQYSLGAMHATSDLELEDRMVRAIEAAAKWDPGNVRLPITKEFIARSK